jgi:hypothetical protein
MAEATAKRIASAVVAERCEAPFQMSKFIRPAGATRDEFGIDYAPGALQARDLQLARAVFSHRYFIDYVFSLNRTLWRDFEMRIYQIQAPIAEGGVRVYGTIITDGLQNLVRWCADGDTRRRRGERTTMQLCMQRLCTPASIQAYRPD